jgi:hypothetical protein
MDTPDAARTIGIHPKELTRFLRRTERALGLPANGYARRRFTDRQVAELGLAYWQSRNRRTGTTT